MSDLPESWVEVPIGSVARIVGGGTPPSKDPQNFVEPGKGIPWVTPADLSGYRKQLIERGARDLTEAGYAACGATLMPQGTVLFSSRAPIGYVAIAANEISTNQGFKSFVLPPEIDARYTYYQLKWLKPEAEAIATGTTFKELSGAATATLPFKLAPAAEQTRIANQLDTLLTRIQSCNDRFDAIPGLLKRFRQAVLNSAVVGRMTPIIDALSEPLRNGKSVRDGNGLPVLRLTALKSQIVNLNEVKYGDWSSVTDTDRFLVHDGDYLVSRGNGSKDYVGRGGLVVGCNRPIAFPDTMIRFRPDVSQLLPGYLQLVWESEGVRTQITNSAKTTAGIWKVSQTDLERIIIPLPSLSKQAEIVRHVEALFTLADRMEARATAARNQAQRLSPLVLSKAFRGELVPQDPQDESAIDLLNRITAAGSPAPKKRIAKAAAPGNSKVKVQGVGNRWNGEETLGATMKLEVVPDNYLEIFISAADGISAKELWQESKLGIDDFYAQLSKEIGNGLLTVDAQDESKICKIPKSRRGQS